jgi:exodeoxyribonuclease VII small subunit
MAASDAAPAPTPTPQTFESALERLTDIVEHLEGGELPLEESLRLFEEGVKLSRLAQTRLDSAEKRVEELLGLDEHGNPLVRELPGK